MFPALVIFCCSSPGVLMFVVYPSSHFLHDCMALCTGVGWLLCRAHAGQCRTNFFSVFYSAPTLVTSYLILFQPTTVCQADCCWYILFLTWALRLLLLWLGFWGYLPSHSYFFPHYSSYSLSLSLSLWPLSLCSSLSLSYSLESQAQPETIYYLNKWLKSLIILQLCANKWLLLNRNNYLCPYNCVQIICSWLEYIYNCMQKSS